MPEETKESKAQKLAAARKKLKEYQKRGNDGDVAAVVGGTPTPGSGGSMSSNLSEKSDSELNLVGNGTMTTSDIELPKEVENTNINTDVPMAINMETPPPADVGQFPASTIMPSAASYFGSVTSASDAYLSSFSNESQPNLNAIQVLITEKAQLTSELNKCRSICREKDLELEELRTQFTNTTHRLEELQQRFVEHQQNTEQLRHTNTELQQKLTQAKATDEDQSSHVDELKKQLTVVQTRSNELEQQFKDKCNELEMSQIRIRQLSDEANISKDNRVETLTQTQFMYEQQIRDLQAMVQQLSQDKEQANIQYQNYATHLNSEVVKLNEKNSELMDECSKFEERERQLIDHISGLEREIQKNISRQDQLREEKKQESSVAAPELLNEIEKLKDQINDFDLERHEFQLKIKSQEDRLEKLTAELHQKQNETEEMREHLENVSSEQPDKVKLLATLESDKVAASRALTQNAELKKQLDELELRFVQLTNDKADLMNKLDSEEYANREMRTNYAAMEERLHSIDERFKFKDEEMIRLSHENVELTQKNMIMQQEMDRLKHYEVREYSDRSHGEHEGSNQTFNTESVHHQYLASEEAKENGHEDHHHDHHHDHQHDHTEGTCDHHHHDEGEHKHDHGETHYHQSHSSPMPHIATTEAVEKLQLRFTQLMSQVADLTDEKQRLEHLVLQLQGETETIGEYIALYQTQRRILKQREYEKAAQMKLLQQEREQMSEKITMLNSLVSSLGVELPQNMRLKEHLNAALAESVSIEPSDGEDGKMPEMAVAGQQQWHNQAEMSINQKLNNTESQQILTKIQNIITEIKENTKEVPTVTHSVDHFNCCLGKFEVV